MNLFSCLHPKVIRNPYTDERIAVPCGRCAACRNNRSYKWVQRLNLEMSCHPYCVFFTLTYNNDHLPKVYFDKVTRSFYDGDGEVLFCIDDKEEHFPLNSMSQKDWSYLYNAPYFGVLNFQHVIDFKKRLLSRVRYYEKESSKAQVRSFIVGEYGSTLFRPHYHGLLFFESPWLAENFREVIYSCWSSDNRCSVSSSLGCIDAQFVSSNASSYVASYLNCSSRLPSVYLCQRFRQKHLCSKRPPLGSIAFKNEAIQKVFFECSPIINIYRKSDNRYVTMPLPSSLENSLFPKLKGFNDIPHYVRVALYGLIVKSKEVINSYSQFLDYTEKLCSRNIDGDVSNYLQTLACVPSAFSRLYSICRRTLYNCLIYQVSLEDYVSKIERYYDNKAYMMLKAQFLFEEFYSKEHELKDLNFIDFVLCEDKKNLSEEEFNRISPVKDFEVPEKETVFAYYDYKSKMEHIDKQNCKSKFKNEYLRVNQINDLNKLIFRLYG